MCNPAPWSAQGEGGDKAGLRVVSLLDFGLKEEDVVLVDTRAGLDQMIAALKGEKRVAWP